MPSPPLRFLSLLTVGTLTALTPLNATYAKGDPEIKFDANEMAFSGLPRYMKNGQKFSVEISNINTLKNNYKVSKEEIVLVSQTPSNIEGILSLLDQVPILKFLKPSLKIPDQKGFTGKGITEVAKTDFDNFITIFTKFSELTIKDNNKLITDVESNSKIIKEIYALKFNVEISKDAEKIPNSAQQIKDIKCEILNLNKQYAETINSSNKAILSIISKSGNDQVIDQRAILMIKELTSSADQLYKERLRVLNIFLNIFTACDDFKEAAINVPTTIKKSFTIDKPADFVNLKISVTPAPRTNIKVSDNLLIRIVDTLPSSEDSVDKILAALERIAASLIKQPAAPPAVATAAEEQAEEKSVRIDVYGRRLVEYSLGGFGTPWLREQKLKATPVGGLAGAGQFRFSSIQEGSAFQGGAHLMHYYKTCPGLSPTLSVGIDGNTNPSAFLLGGSVMFTVGGRQNKIFLTAGQAFKKTEVATVAPGALLDSSEVPHRTGFRQGWFFGLTFALPALRL